MISDFAVTSCRRHYRVASRAWSIRVLSMQASEVIECLHSVPGEQDNKEDGGHIGVPDKSISSKLFCLGTPTWRL